MTSTVLKDEREEHGRTDHFGCGIGYYVTKFSGGIIHGASQYKPNYFSQVTLRNHI